MKRAIEQVNNGLDYKSIVNEIAEDHEGSRKQLERKIQHQLSNINSVITRQRALSSGITKAIWVTRKDKKVRDAHSILEGVEFDLTVGAPERYDPDGYDGKVGGLTGQMIFPKQQWGCRCSYKLIVEDDPYAALLENTHPAAAENFKKAKITKR